MFSDFLFEEGIGFKLESIFFFNFFVFSLSIDRGEGVNEALPKGLNLAGEDFGVPLALEASEAPALGNSLVSTSLSAS